EHRLNAGQIFRYLRWVDSDGRKRNCVRTCVFHGGAVGDRDEQGNGAVVCTATSHPFAKFRGEPSKQRVTGSAKAFRASIPVAKIDGDRDRRDHNIAVGAIWRDRSRWRWSRSVGILPATT